MATPQPLGIDIGTRRVRAALGEKTYGNGLRVVAVAARDLPDDPWEQGKTEFEFAVVLIEELLRELATRERRCVTAIGVPHATVKIIRFPKMTWLERRHAARYEAARIDATTEGKSRVRLHPVDRGSDLYAVGTFNETLLHRRLSLLRKAGLRVVGVDHDGMALERMLPNYDAIVDIGHDWTRLHARQGDKVASVATRSGGFSVTQSIAADLSIDMASAEKRKRIIGVAGGGESARRACAGEIRCLVDRARGYGFNIVRIAFVGNGARLPGLATLVQELAGASVDLPVADALRACNIPDDVLRSAAPDWMLATALAGWSVA